MSVDPGLRIIEDKQDEIYSATVKIHPAYETDQISGESLPGIVALRRFECETTTSILCEDPDTRVSPTECRSCTLVYFLHGPASLVEYQVIKGTANSTLYFPIQDSSSQPLEIKYFLSSLMQALYKVPKGSLFSH